MPSKSPAQANLMRAVAHGWKKPGGGGLSQSVAREFVNADKGYQEGGDVERLQQMIGEMDLEMPTGVMSDAERNYMEEPGAHPTWDDGATHYAPKTAEEVGPALEQMFSDYENKTRARDEETINYAWDKSKPIESDTNFDKELGALSGAEQVKFIKPRLIRAMSRMKDIGQSKFGKRYSVNDYSSAQREVNLWRDKWSKALQKQSQEAQMPTQEEIERIGVNERGESIFMNGEQGYANGGPVDGGYTFKQLVKQLNGGIGSVFRIMRGLEDGTYIKDPNTELIYMREPTGETVGTEVVEENVDVITGGLGNQGPRGGRGPGGGGRGNRGGGGGRGGRGGGGGGNRPPRVIPPGVDPITGGPPVTPPDGGGVTPPPYVQPPAGRESDHSRELAAHNARIRAMLGTGSAQGGSVGYAEGGEVDRPGHAEGANPYPVGSARYKQWERYNHKDPKVAPPAAAVEEEPPSWIERLFAPAADLGTKTERALEEMEEARGGHIKKYAGGGLASATAPPGRMMPPRGGRPQPAGMMNPRQRMQPGKPMVDPRSMPPQPPRGGMPPRGMPRRGMPPQGRGRPMPANPYASGGEDPNAGVTGGPQLPPNMQGSLQTMRMQNRPRRGFSGPAGAGGPPGGGNRVGQQDQQGGLARALQRGTGRPPMSRRSGFPGNR